MLDDLDENDEQTEARYIDEKGAHLEWRLRPEVAQAINAYVKTFKVPAVDADMLHATVFESYIPGFQIQKKQLYEIAPASSIFMTVRGSRSRPGSIIFNMPEITKRHKELSDIEDRVAERRGLRLSQKYLLNPHIKIIEYADPMKVTSEVIEKMTLFFKKVPLIFASEHVDTRDLRPEQMPVQVNKPKEMSAEENKERIRKSQQAQDYRDRKK